MRLYGFGCFWSLVAHTIAAGNNPGEKSNTVAGSFASSSTQPFLPVSPETSVATISLHESSTALTLSNPPIETANNPSLTPSTASTSLPVTSSAHFGDTTTSDDCTSWWCLNMITQSTITSKIVWEQEYADYYNPYWQMGQNSLASLCSTQWASWVSQWIETVDLTTLKPSLDTSLYWTTDGTTWYVSDSTTTFAFATDMPTAYEFFAQTSNAGICLGNVDFTATAPCCSTCTFEVGTVEVYHWPTQTTPTISTLTNAAGVTFIYPSIYVAFQSVVARDLCGTVGSAITTVTTIGFDATELSIANYYHFDSKSTISTWTPPTLEQIHYSEAIWADNITCANLTTTFWMVDIDIVTWSQPFTSLMTYARSWDKNASTIRYTTYTTHPTPQPYAMTYNPCSPWLSFPHRMYTMLLGNHSCRQDIKGLHDPPSWLISGSAFLPIITRVSDHLHPTATNDMFTTPAVPQAVVTRTQAVETQPGSPSGSPLITTTRERQPQNTNFSKLPPVFNIGTTKVTADSASNLVIDGKTLRPGEQITYSSTLISMASDGGAIVFGGTSTQYLDPSFALGTQILSAGGPAVTAGGKTYTLLQGGSSVVVDGSTEAVTQVTKGSAPAFDGNIASGSDERVGIRLWSLWVAVVVTIFVVGEIL